MSADPLHELGGPARHATDGKELVRDDCMGATVEPLALRLTPVQGLGGKGPGHMP